MRKQFLATLLALCLVLGMLPASAFAEELQETDTLHDEISPVVQEEDGREESLYAEENGTTTRSKSDTDIAYPVTGGNIYFDTKTGTITDCDERVREVAIPRTINGVSVTSVGHYAFGSSGLTSITLPDSVTTIGDRAFDHCRRLTSITLPDSVTSIGVHAFYYCSGLTDITLPDGITSITEGTFEDCISLTSITLPDSVTSIKRSAFEGCSGLTSITLPDSITSIEQYAFYRCSGLTSINIPDGVSSIEQSAFSYSGLTNITIPDSIISIRDDAFRGCSGLSSIIIPDSVTSIGKNVFYGCNSLTSAGPIGGGYSCEFGWVTEIPSNAFYGSELMSITIPDGITSIGWELFCYCRKLTTIAIPDSVTSIGPEAFRYCSELTSITIPDSVTSIGRGTFGNCSKLTSITIPDSVTSIEPEVFIGCSGLTSITIPDSVTSTGQEAFHGCSGLTSINLPDGIRSISSDTFWGCSGLTSITIPDSVKYIREGAFRGCSGLTSITIPDGVKSIEPEVFIACSRLTSITIPDSITSIGNYAFRGCTELTDVYYAGSEAQWGAISIGASNEKLTSATIHYNSTGPDSPDVSGDYTQEELQKKYIEEHRDYYKSSYSSDIILMDNSVGLGFLLEDAQEDLGAEAYKVLSVAEGYVSMISSFLKLNPADYIDINWGDGYKFSFKVPGQTVIDLGSSEYSAILLQLLANDTVYNGIVDTFSMNYQKNICNYSKSIADNFVKLTKLENADEIQKVKNDMLAASETIRTADPKSVKYATAYVNFEELGNKSLDLNKTKAHLGEISTVANDAFSFLGTITKELESIGKAYQYYCWAEAYAETSSEFKKVLNAVAEKASKNAQFLIQTDPAGGGHLSNPYCEANMCMGLSKAITSFTNTMGSYAKDSHEAFIKQVIDSTGDSCLNLTLGFISNSWGKFAGATLCPELAAINMILNSGKNLIDTFTTIDDRYKMLLSVESIQVMTKFLKELSNEYGKGLLAAPSSPSPLPFPDIRVSALDLAKLFDESIKMYKTATMLACDYGMKYEKLKLVDAAVKADLVPDWWYESGGTTGWQEQVSTSSTAINLLAYQKLEVSDIHCHEDGLDYNSSTGLIEYNNSRKVIGVSCPVTVTVIAPDGTQLAYLTNGSATVADGYEPYFFIVPIDETESVKVAVIPDDKNYQVLINGTGSGTMDVFVGKYDGNIVTNVETFANFHITSDTTGYLDFNDEDNPLGNLVIDEDIYGGNEYTIRFDANGGNVTPTSYRTTNSKLITLPSTTRDGFIFNGWYTNPDGGTRVDENRVYTENVTLYAHWVPTGTASVPGDLNGDGKVTMADVMRLARGAAGYVILTEQEQKAGDVTGDGKITMADVIRLARYAAGYSPSL